MRWIALFSHTGELIYNLINKTGIKPDVVYHHPYNNIQPFPDLLYVLMPKNPDVYYYHTIFKSGDVITLHGFMKIIPPEICMGYTIVNLHPAPIYLYPLLKGKDPIERMLLDIHKYNKVGSVIHLVTNDVDSGSIILCKHEQALEDINKQVRLISLGLWITFINKFIKEK